MQLVLAELKSKINSHADAKLQRFQQDGEIKESCMQQIIEK